MNKIQSYFANAHRAVFGAAAVFAMLMLGAAALSFVSPLAALITAAALTALFLIVLQRILHAAEIAHEAEKNIFSQTAELASQCGKTLTFAFKNGKLLACRNSLNGRPVDMDAAKTLSGLEKAVGVDEDDSGRIAEAASKLAVGETARICLNYQVEEDERTLRIYLKRLENAPDTTVACATDYTRETVLREQAEAEEAFEASMRGKCISKWQINATEGKWRCLDAVEPSTLRMLNMTLGQWNGYEADLDGVIKEYFDTQDYYGFAETMSCDGISKMLRTGKTDFTTEYRVKSKNGEDYEWHRQNVHIFADPETGDTMCNIYVQNVNEEKKAEFERRERTRIMQKSLTALGGVFFGLYYVDLVNEICYTTKARGGEIVERLSAPYPQALKEYVKNYVYPEDQEAFLAAVDAYKLRRSIVEGSRYIQFDFRGMRADAYYWSSMFIQAARFENGTICDVVIALQRTERTFPDAE